MIITENLISLVTSWLWRWNPTILFSALRTIFTVCFRVKVLLVILVLLLFCFLFGHIENVNRIIKLML